MSEAWLGIPVRLALFVLFAGSYFYSPSDLNAQVTSTITDVAVVKKPGHVDGDATATVKGPTTVKGKTTVTEKKGRIASHALQVWRIMDGQGALLLLSPEKKGEQNR